MIGNNMEDYRLKYRINSWSDLVHCESNTCRDLSISVISLVGDGPINGSLISLNHPDYGVLFSTVVNASGSMLVESVEQLERDEILAQLKRFGYYIEWSNDIVLSPTQYRYLSSLLSTNYTYIRIIRIHTLSGKDPDSSDVRVVAFNPNCVSEEWMNNAYSPSEKEFKEAIYKVGCAMIICDPTDGTWNWSWLYGNIIRIEDILTDKEVNCYEGSM